MPRRHGAHEAQPRPYSGTRMGDALELAQQTLRSLNKHPDFHAISPIVDEDLRSRIMHDKVAKALFVAAIYVVAKNANKQKQELQRDILALKLDIEESPRLLAAYVVALQVYVAVDLPKGKPAPTPQHFDDAYDTLYSGLAHSWIGRQSYRRFHEEAFDEIPLIERPAKESAPEMGI